MARKSEGYIIMDDYDFFTYREFGYIYVGEE